MKSGTLDLTLDDLIAQGHECQYRRRIGATALRRLLGRIPGQCTWCAGVVNPPRVNWCGRECIAIFNRRCLGWYRDLIRKRDGGICAKCGAYDERYEIDHVVPVVEGGGLCDLDGLRTLCLPCHKLATKELRLRLSAIRRNEELDCTFEF